MHLKNTETPLSLSFTLFFEQIQQAHEIYEFHCFSLDFVTRSLERKKDEIGLCTLPYESLSDESELLNAAYRIYCEKRDCNIAYNDTLDSVIDIVEQQIANGISYCAMQVKSIEPEVNE